MEWSDDFVDMSTRYVDPTDAERLYRKYPDLPHSAREGCPTCRGRERYVWQGQEQECNCKLQLQLAKHYFNANIGELFQRLDWSDYESDPTLLAAATKFLTNHRTLIEGGIGLLYYGQWGTGKTMLANLIAKDCVKLGYSTYFVTFAEMVDMFTKGWGDNRERAYFESRVVNSRVLVLDDVGKEFRAKNNLSESTFDHVLRQRVLNLRPTIVTTNMDLNDLDEGYGRAIFSLLRERSIQVKADGDDWRGRASARSLKEAQQGWRRPIF